MSKFNEFFFCINRKQILMIISYKKQPINSNPESN